MSLMIWPKVDDMNLQNVRAKYFCFKIFVVLEKRISYKSKLYKCSKRSQMRFELHLFDNYWWPIKNLDLCTYVNGS